jgi:hypothetical protein
MDQAASVIGSTIQKIKTSSNSSFATRSNAYQPDDGGEEISPSLPSSLPAPPKPFRKLDSSSETGSLQAHSNKFVISDGGGSSRNSLMDLGSLLPPPTSFSTDSPSTAEDPIRLSSIQQPRKIRFSYPDVSIEPSPTSPTSQSSGGKSSESDETSPVESNSKSPELPTVSDLMNGSQDLSAQDLSQFYTQKCGEMGVKPVAKVLEIFDSAMEKDNLPPQSIDFTGTSYQNRMILRVLILFIRLGSTLTIKNVKPLASILLMDFGLKQLILNDCGLDDTSLKPILHSLLSSTSLVWLSVAFNKKIRSLGLKFIAVFVKKVSFLLGIFFVLSTPFY